MGIAPPALSIRHHRPRDDHRRRDRQRTGRTHSPGRASPGDRLWIKPAGCPGRVRLFDRRAIEQVRRELGRHRPPPLHAARPGRCGLNSTNAQVRKASLDEGSQRLIAMMHRIGFGRIESLSVSGLAGPFRSASRVIREVRLRPSRRAREAGRRRRLRRQERVVDLRRAGRRWRRHRRDRGSSRIACKVDRSRR